MNPYGASALGEFVLEKYGFTVENLIAKAKALLGNADSWLPVGRFRAEIRAVPS